MAIFYDTSTVDGYVALERLMLVVDIRLGYIAADGVTLTPIPGRSSWAIGGIYPFVPLPLGETSHWFALKIHPTQSGRYALLVDQNIVSAVNSEIARLTLIASPTTAQTNLLSALSSLTAVTLDSSWTPTPP